MFEGFQNRKSRIRCGNNFIIHHKCMHQGSTQETTDEGMRGGGRNTEPPREQVPENGCNKASENYFEIDKIFVDGFGNSITDFKFADNIHGNKKCCKVPQRCPQYRLKRGKNFSRNDGCNRIGRVMKAVDEIKY